MDSKLVSVRPILLNYEPNWKPGVFKVNSAKSNVVKSGVQPDTSLFML